MLKRGLVIGGAAIAGLLAIAGIASAASKPSGGTPNPTPEDPHSPEACTAYKQQRSQVKASCDQLYQTRLDLDVQRIEAASNEQWDLVAQLDAARAGINGQYQTCLAQVQQLDNLIAGCS